VSISDVGAGSAAHSLKKELSLKIKRKNSWVLKRVNQRKTCKQGKVNLSGFLEGLRKN
jgi:hypothetical protein